MLLTLTGEPSSIAPKHKNLVHKGRGLDSCYHPHSPSDSRPRPLPVLKVTALRPANGGQAGQAYWNWTLCSAQPWPFAALRAGSKAPGRRHDSADHAGPPTGQVKPVLGASKGHLVQPAAPRSFSAAPQRCLPPESSSLKPQTPRTRPLHSLWLQFYSGGQFCQLSSLGCDSKLKSELFKLQK